VTSLRLAAIVTAATLLIAYPTACALVRIRRPLIAGLAYVLIFSPLLMSVVVRSYGWMLLLADSGMIKTVLGATFLPIVGIRLIYNETGVIIALVHILLPFAVLPLVSVLTQIPESYREAALDLGAGSFDVFRRVTFPLSLPGIIAAAEIVFTLSMSSFVTPSMLGGGRVLVLSRLVYDNIGTLEWGLAAVQAVTLLGLALSVLVVLGLFNRATYAAKEA
jgi:putative spermidine/putrescine transport system permease protein